MAVARLGRALQLLQVPNPPQESKNLRVRPSASARHTLARALKISMRCGGGQMTTTNRITTWVVPTISLCTIAAVQLVVIPAVVVAILAAVVAAICKQDQSN